MGAFFFPAAKTLLTTTPLAFHLVPINVILFRTAPGSLSEPGAPWQSATTKVQLLSYPGWEEVSGVAGYATMPKLANLTCRPPDAPSATGIFANNYYYTFNNDYTFVLGQAIGIGAIGFQRVSDGMMIMVTNTPTGSLTNVGNGDKLTASQNTSFPDQFSRTLFTWFKNPVKAEPTEGPVMLLKKAPTFELSNTLHVWLYPQRANMIANPSFEFDGSYWAPAVTRVNDPAPGGGAWSGKFTGTAPFAVESNVWSTSFGGEQSELWTFQLLAKCAPMGADEVCRLKVGLVSWTSEYLTTTVDWGTETWELQPDSWVRIAGIREAPQAYEVMLRLEVDGSEITIDKVLCERGALVEWPYFDGDETYAAPDAYSWYGGESMRHISYSMWYSGRRAVLGRLFAAPTDTDDPDDVITDSEVLAAGAVYRWVPAGVTVVPHIDVFYPGDLRSPPPPKTKPVLPYYSDSAYLLASTTGVTTPDPGVPPLKCVFVSRLRGPVAASGSPRIAGQYETSGQYSWSLFRDATNDRLGFVVSSNGTATAVQPQASSPINPNPTVDDWVAVSLDGSSGQTVLKTYRSTDLGVTWEYIATDTVALTTPFDSNSVMRIGAQTAAGVAAWDGRIYSVESRTGVDPTGKEQLGATVEFIGVPSNYLLVPWSAAIDASADLELVVRVRVADWDAQPSGYQTFMAHGGWSFRRFPFSPRWLEFWWYDSAGGGHQFVAQYNAGVLPPNSYVWLRLRLRLDDGIPVAAGGSSVRLNGTAGCYIEGPDIAALAGAAKIEIEFDATLDDWTPAATQWLMNQGGGLSSDRGFDLRCTTPGFVYFFPSQNGTSDGGTYGAAVASADGRHVVGGTWIADNGTNSTWQPKVDGAIQGSLSTSTRCPTGLYNSTKKVELGRHGDGTGRMIGNIHSVKIWVNDVLRASPNFTAMVAGQTSVTDAQGNVWTLKGAASLANPAVDGHVVEMAYSTAQTVTAPTSGWTVFKNETRATPTSLAPYGSGLYIGDDLGNPLNGSIKRAIQRNGVGWTNLIVDVDDALIPNDSVTSFPSRTGQGVTVGRAGSVNILQPILSQLLWRFDANEYPGTGTNFTDPRGRVWTLGSATVVPAVPMSIANPWV